MFGFFEVAHIQVAVSDTVVGICKCCSVLSFFQLDIFLEVITCLCVVLTVEGNVS